MEISVERYEELVESEVRIDILAGLLSSGKYLPASDCLTILGYEDAANDMRKEEKNESK